MRGGWLINTHHHADHTFGNGEFRGVARSVVAHVQADEHLRGTPGGTRAPVRSTAASASRARDALTCAWEELSAEAQTGP